MAKERPGGDPHAQLQAALAELARRSAEEAGAVEKLMSRPPAAPNAPLTAAQRAELSRRFPGMADEIQRRAGLAPAAAPAAAARPRPLADAMAQALQQRQPPGPKPPLVFGPGGGPGLSFLRPGQAPPAPPQQPPGGLARPQAGGGPVPVNIVRSIALRLAGAEAAAGRGGAQSPAEAARRAAEAQGMAAGAAERLSHEIAATVAGLASLAAVSRAASLASPNSAATMRVSFDLVMQQVGKFFVPAMEQLARQAQEAAQSLEKIPKPVREAAGEVGATAAAGGPGSLSKTGLGLNIADSIFKAINGKSISQATAEERAKNSGFGTTAAGKFLMNQMDRLFGKGKLPFGRSLEGLPKSQFVGFEQFNEQATLRALNTGTPEQTLLENQLKALEEIARNTGGGGATPRLAPAGAGQGPAW